jgi:hypothetical protein
VDRSLSGSLSSVGGPQALGGARSGMVLGGIFIYFIYFDR